MSKEKCLIITGYIEGDLEKIVSHAELSESFVICADSGYDLAVDAGIVPDIIMGDFDSLKGTLPADIEIIKVPSHKDDTDTGLALAYAKEHGYKEIKIAGGFGGRLDHTIANIQDVARYTKEGLKIKMVDGRNALCVLIPGEYSVEKKKGENLSLFAYGGDVLVSETGVEYPLDHHTLTNTYPLGVSNSVVADRAIITVHEGIVLMITSV